MFKPPFSSPYSLVYKALIGVLVCTPFICVAATNNYSHESTPRFYERKAEGWFWYDDPIFLEEEIEEEPEPEPIIEIVTPEPTEPDEAFEEPSELGPPIFSTAWIRENLPIYLDIAIDNPTVENVQAYMYLQRLMFDKSERFALTTQRVVTGDPMLDETTRRPLATFAAKALDTKASQLQNEALRELAEKAGIFFFFSSNCVECNQQAPLIKSLQDNLGFAVVPISIDGKAAHDFPWQEFKTDEGQAQILNVKALPALYLASADGEFEAIGQSVYALPELRDRILFAAARKGWINKEDLNKTRPILDDTNIAEILDALDFGDAFEAQDNEIVPAGKILEFIQTAMGGSSAN